MVKWVSRGYTNTAGGMGRLYENELAHRFEVGLFKIVLSMAPMRQPILDILYDANRETVRRWYLCKSILWSEKASYRRQHPAFHHALIEI